MGKFSDAVDLGKNEEKQKKQAALDEKRRAAEKEKTNRQRGIDWLESTFIPALNEANSEIEAKDMKIAHGLDVSGAYPQVHFQIHSVGHNGPKFGVMVKNGIEVRIYKEGNNYLHLGDLDKLLNSGRNKVDDLLLTILQEYGRSIAS